MSLWVDRHLLIIICLQLAVFAPARLKCLCHFFQSQAAATEEGLPASLIQFLRGRGERFAFAWWENSNANNSV